MWSIRSGLSSPTTSRRNSNRNNWLHATAASWLALMKTDLKASPSAVFPRASSASRISWPPKSPYKPSKITWSDIPIVASNRWFSMCLRILTEIFINDFYKTNNIACNQDLLRYITVRFSCGFFSHHRCFLRNSIMDCPVHRTRTFASTPQLNFMRVMKKSAEALN